MSCVCGSCIETSAICIPRGDGKTIVVSVFDEDGDEFDISGAAEIVFIVADGVFLAGNVGPGGVVRIEKRLTLNDITIAGNLYQFFVKINGVDTAGFTKTNYYWEAMVETVSGVRNTVASGIFKSENTMIKDLI